MVLSGSSKGPVHVCILDKDSQCFLHNPEETVFKIGLKCPCVDAMGFWCPQPSGVPAPRRACSGALGNEGCCLQPALGQALGNETSHRVVHSKY